jgi:hypothetical protein
MLFRPKVGTWIVLKPGIVYLDLEPDFAFEVVRCSKSHRSLFYVGHPGAGHITGVHKRDVRYATQGEILEARRSGPTHRIPNPGPLSKTG